jgi:radical SAM superfamily enzyme YgiQ (UPF0313 family)
MRVQSIIIPHTIHDTIMATTKKPAVLLIHPYTGFWDSYRSAPSLPLNLLHAASLLVDDFEVRIIDVRAARDWRAEVRAGLSLNPCLVGLTIMTGPSVESSVEVMKFIKKNSAAHATMVPDTTLQNPLVDYVIVGPGENALVELAGALARGEQPAQDHGIFSKSSSDPLHNAKRAPALDLDSAPEIPYHLVNVRDYFQTYDGIDGYLPMETSRGCNRGCTHCYNSVSRAGPWRAQSAQRVIERLKHIKNIIGASAVYFVDDNFFMDVNRALDIADGAASLGLKWQIQGIDLQTLGALGHDTLQHLVDTGLKRVTIGIESGSDKIRTMLHKKPASREVLDIIRRLNKYPFIIYCSFITNFPGETAQDVKKTIRLISDLCDANPMFRNSPVYQFVPFPGTTISNNAEQNGFSRPGRLEDWGRISYERGYGKDNLGLGRDFYQALYFITLFNDRKYLEYLNDPGLRILSLAYHPIARFRLKHGLFQMTPEIRAYEWISNRRRKRNSPPKAGA